MLNFEETIYIGLLIILVFSVLFRSYTHQSYFEIWNPLTFVSIFFAYYVIVGPLFSVFNNDTFMRGIDHRSFLLSGWKIGFLSFCSILMGYSVPNSFWGAVNKFQWKPEQLKNVGVYVFVIAFITLLIFAGSGFVNKLNFMDSTVGGTGYRGSFVAYLMHAVNLFNLSSLLLFYYALKTRKYLLFCIVALLSFSIFMNEAFRFRLVMMLLGLLMTFHIYKQSKPNLLLLLSLGLGFVMLMGVIEYSRSYGRGIDITKVEGLGSDHLLEGGLNESAVFSATSYLISQIDDGRIEYSGFDMFYNALSSPIPRRIWPGKPEGEYFLGTINKLYGEVHGRGQAILYFGEYYLSFGWFGVLTLSFLLGLIFKRQWKWFLKNAFNPYALVSIALFNSFIYVIISRGYLTQVITIYFFAVYPSIYIVKKLKRQVYG